MAFEVKRLKTGRNGPRGPERLAGGLDLVWGLVRVLVWDLAGKSGVADGTRTRDNRNHNPGLYQLSYSHQRSRILTCFILEAASA
jgi:hypothetical protein